MVEIETTIMLRQLQLVRDHQMLLPEAISTTVTLIELAAKKIHDQTVPETVKSYQYIKLCESAGLWFSSAARLPVHNNHEVPRKIRRSKRLLRRRPTFAFRIQSDDSK